MNISRIAFFAVLLLVLAIVTGALVTLAFGENISSLKGILSLDIATTVVAICVFTYMSWSYPVKPYLTATIAGLTATLLDVLVASQVLPNMFWTPAALVVDVLELLIAVALGTSLGLYLNRRGSVN